MAESEKNPVLSYSRVWEDYSCIYKGLDINQEDIILSITSAGDNVLNLLLEEPKLIYAVDMNIAQNAVLELKLTAITHLSYEEFLALIGEIPSDRRLELYHSIENYLPEYAKNYWNSNNLLIEDGVADSGKLEKYLTELSKKHLPTLIPNEKLDQYHESQTLDEQKRCLQEFPLRELRSLIAWLFATDNLKKGRSEQCYNYVDLEADETGKIFAEKYMQMMQREIPVKDNFYFSWLNRGRRGYDPVSKPYFAPPYLTKDNFSKLKLLTDRVSVHTATVTEFLPNITPKTITKANLSNIFEYLSVEETHSLYTLLYQAMTSGGRVYYLELFLPRPPPSEMFTYDQKLTEELRSQDRSFCYTCNVYTVN